MKRLVILTVLLLFTSVFVSGAGASAGNNPEFVNITIDDNKSIVFANHSGSTTEGNWISLSGGDPIELPSPFTLTYYGNSFSSSTNGRINVTVDVEDNTDYVVPYPHTTHDMFTNVPGKNNVSMHFNGTTYFADNRTDVYLVKISRTSLKYAFNNITNGNIEGFYYNLLYNPYERKLNAPLDVNGDMNLAFSEVDAGDYAIFILLNNSDLNKSSILSATTFQVLEYESTTIVPSEVIRGSTFNANISLTNAPTDTDKYTYGAALVHESAYYAEMQLKFNGTRPGTNLTLNGVDIIQGYEVLGVGLSSVNITTVLDTISDGIDPIDGYVKNTTINANNTSIPLNTSGLNAGNYILLTGVYNSGDKLVAFNQSEIIISTKSNVLCGFVKDPSNGPVPGAEIRIGTTIMNTTDASGYYRISGVNNGSFVSASKDNYVTNSTTVTILADEINRQDFTLTPTKAKVYVTVKDDEGTAIKGALVSINTTPVTTGTTDPDGECTLYLSIESELAALFTINASKANYETNEEVISLAIAEVKTVSLPLNQSRVVVGLASGETAVKFAENTTDATFLLYIENYGGSEANFTVENFTTATVVINQTSIMMEPSTTASIMVNVTSSDVGTYPVTIKVSNTTQGKSAAIDLVAIMKNCSVKFIDDTCTVNGTVSNGSVITDNSDVDTNASVTNGSVFGYCNITGISQVVDSVIMDNSTITNATILGNSMVTTSNVSDYATVIAASVVESSNITGLETIISNAIVTNATVINSVVTGVTISNVTLYGAIVKPNDDGVAVITKGRIVTENVDFRNVYTEIPIEKLVFAQSGTIVGASTVADDRQTLGTYIDINASAGSIINVSVCLISPDSPEGATAAPLVSDISGMKDEEQLGKFIHIKNSNTVNSAEVRIYINQVDKDNYKKFYVACHTDGNKLVKLGDSIGTPVYDEEIGCWYAAGNTTHFSTFTLIGANEESDDNGDDNGGSRSGSGGGSTGEDFENILISETEREMVYMNSKVSYSFDIEGNIVRYINFTGLTSAGKVAAKVEMLDHTSTLVEHAPADIVYKNLNIFIGNLGWATSKNIANPTVRFEVEKSWISENNIDKSTITLNHYSGDKWNPVLTTMIGEYPDYLYFESQVPGFSPFAVTGKTIGSGEVTPTETGVSPDTGTATPTSTEEKPGIPGFEAIGALGMITVVYCMYRRRG